MTALRSALEDYLILRRSMGFKLHRAGRLLAPVRRPLRGGRF